MHKQKTPEIPLIRLEKLNTIFCLPNLFVKDESKNIFGTWKDRRSKLIFNKIAKNKLIPVLITSGNAGFSLAKIAQPRKIICIVDQDLKPSVKKMLLQNCSKVITANLSKKLTLKQIIHLIQNHKKEKFLDVSNGYYLAYQGIIKELKKDKPDYIICPVGSGEAFWGLYTGIKKYHLKTKLIGLTPKTLDSFADKLPTIWSPYFPKIKGILKEGHKIIKLNEKEIRDSYSFAKKYLNCEPSSAIVFGVFKKVKFNENSKIILINSGKGIQ